MKRTAALTQGNIGRHAEGDCLGQRCGLGEEVQVVKSKDQMDWFVHLNCNLMTESEGERSNNLTCANNSKSNAVFPSLGYILTASSSLSTLLVWDSLTFPVPSSPVAENLTPSLAQEIMTASPIWDRSRQIRANSPEGIFTTQLYSCSWRGTQKGEVRNIMHENMLDPDSRKMWQITYWNAQLFHIQVHQFHLIIWHFFLVCNIKR